MSLWKKAFNVAYRLVGSPLRFLYCPKCSREHVDLGEWAGRPHRTHLCANCGEKWAPEIGTRTVGI